jgi:hypothetical protein
MVFSHQAMRNPLFAAVLRVEKDFTTQNYKRSNGN